MIRPRVAFAACAPWAQYHRSRFIPAVRGMRDLFRSAENQSH
ncbi:hypothetical protein [Azospirillum argentinense]